MFGGPPAQGGTSRHSLEQTHRRLRCPRPLAPLGTPCSKLAAFVNWPVRHYRESIEAAIERRLNNGIYESVNAAIGRVRTNTRGFHHPEAFTTMIMVDRTGIAPTLPRAAS